jgi:hypothetical protein
MECANQRIKHILWNTPKSHAGQAGRRKEHRPAEEVGQRDEDGPAGPDPKGIQRKIDF